MTEDFFEPLPEPPRPERHRPPVWCQPPEDELASLVPSRQVLARTDQGVAVVLSHIDAFREGCIFRIRVSAHRLEAMDEAEWYEIHETTMDGAGFRHRHGRHDLPDELLRFGVQFADGRKATTTGGPGFPHHQEQEPRGPVLTQHGGGGSGSDRLATSSWSLWLWPLPPPEPFEFVLAWPALGVDLTRIELSGRDIVDAAYGAGPLWPNTAP